MAVGAAGCGSELENAASSAKAIQPQINSVYSQAQQQAQQAEQQAEQQSRGDGSSGGYGY